MKILDKNIFGIKCYLNEGADFGPVFMECQNIGQDSTLWIKENKSLIDTLLLEYGGVVLKNFAVNSVSEFNSIAKIICNELMDYIYRSTPRTRIGGKIFTATEYPSNLSIPLHNENSYALNWPSRIMFFCIIPALQGGETPVADSRKVLSRIDPQIISEFISKGVSYVRNYHAGVDLSWEEVFQTESRAVVEEFCDKHSIQYEWLDSGAILRTKQVCQAIIQHPITNDMVWFNQAHLFHVSSLGRDIENLLISQFGYDCLPRNAFFGDGSKISEQILAEIRCAYAKESIIFPWEKGDIMILDNLLMAHGRMPFIGQRKIAVAMS